MARDYRISKELLSADEIIGFLNLDGDYRPRSKLESLSREATQFLYQKTGRDWSADDPVNETAKGAARDYIYQVWYGGDDHVEKRLAQSVIQLQAMVDREGNLYEGTEPEPMMDDDLEYGTITFGGKQR